MRALAVILHYGRPELARQLAESLIRPEPEVRERVLVYDNAAPEPYAGAWRRAPENLYWAGALAWCLEAAREKGFTHLWFLNNDIRFVSPPPFLSRAEACLVELERRLGKTVALWSPAALRNPYHPQMCPAADAEAVLTPLVDGIAPLLSLDAVDAVGGVDAGDNPRGYGADMWLSLRLARAGWATVVDRRLAVRHRYHTTARAVPGFMETAAAQEDAFLTRRLGPGWRNVLEQLKRKVTPLVAGSVLSGSENLQQQEQQ